MKIIIKQRIYLLIVFILIGLSYSLPNIIYTFYPSNNFKGIALVNSMDEWAYTGYIREAAEGNISLKHQYLYEPKIDENPGYMTLQPVPSLVSGFLLRIVNMNMNNFTIIQKFIVPGFMFIVLYMILSSFKCNFSVSILGAVAAMTLPLVFGNNFILFDKGFGIWHLVYSRPTSNIAILFLLLSVYFILSYLNNPKVYKYILICLSGALTLQSYLFTGIVFIVVISSYLLYYLVSKDYKLTIKLLCMIVISLVLSSYTFINGYYFLKYSSVFDVMHFRYIHAPYISYYIIIEIIVLICSYLLIKKYNVAKNISLFLIIIPLSHIIVCNQSILTGINLEPHHFDLLVYPIFTWVVLIISFTVVFVTRFEIIKSYWNTRSRVFKQTLFSLIISFFLVGVLVLVILPEYPRPVGGLFGKLIRGSGEVYKIIFTLLIVFVFLVLLYYYKKGRVFKLLMITYLSTILIITQYFNYVPALDKYHFSNRMQDYAAAFNWLENNTEKESVVLCSPLTGDFMTSYTHNNVYFNDYSMATEENQFKDRFFNQLAFSGIEPDTLRDYISPNSGKFDMSIKFCLFYWRTYGKKGEVETDRGRYIEKYNQEDVDSLVNYYAGFYKNWNLNMVKKYRIDYILLGPIEKNEDGSINNWYFRKTNKFNMLSPLYSDEKVTIYEFKDYKDIN